MVMMDHLKAATLLSARVKLKENGATGTVRALLDLGLDPRLRVRLDDGREIVAPLSLFEVQVPLGLHKGTN